MKKLLFSFLFLGLGFFCFAQENALLESVVKAYDKKDYVSASQIIDEVKEDSNRSKDELLFCFIYESKIKLDSSENKKLTAQKVLGELTAKEQDIKNSRLNGLSDSYYQLVLYCNTVLGNSEKALAAYFKIQNVDEDSVYLAAYCYFTIEKDYRKTEQIFKEYLTQKSLMDFKKTNNRVLYAKTLARNEKYLDAENFYSMLYEDKKLTSDEIFEYAKLLYIQEKYQSAEVKAKESKNPLASYLSGLCAINTKQWKNAEQNLSAYLKQYASVYGYVDSATYYQAYSVYRQGKYKEAYKLFSSFADSTTELNFARHAYELAAKCAVLDSDFKNAATQAEKLVKISFKDEEKQKATIFCAEIYIDCKEYDKAYNLLSQNTYDKSDFALSCWKLIAEIYVKTSDADRADTVYEKIIKDYPRTDDAEEACYKRGELYYGQGKYEKAAERYASYNSKYPSGKYLEPSYYFCGESYLKAKKYEKSLGPNLNLISKFPKSVYTYGAYKNLFEAYYELNNITEAQKIADFMMNNYKSQAVSDGIPAKLKVIGNVKNGASKKMAEKQAEYETKGGSSTVEGRLAGYELFMMYLEDSNDAEAKKIASPLYKSTAKRDEREFYYLGKIAEFYAKQESGAKQAEYYLKAVEYYRQSSKDTSSEEAVALYSAVDAFLKDKKTADAKETAQVLKKLYPDSRQAKNVDKLF